MGTLTPSAITMANALRTLAVELLAAVMQPGFAIVHRKSSVWIISTLALVWDPLKECRASCSWIGRSTGIVMVDLLQR